MGWRPAKSIIFLHMADVGLHVFQTKPNISTQIQAQG